MLLTGITGSLCAQSTNKADQAFEVPGNIVFNRRFMIDLGKGNKLTMDLSDITDLDRLANMDSLLSLFLQDIAPLKDSLADPLSVKRIDYVTDAQGRKKIRIQQWQPKGSSYLISKGELASLRTGQDTVNLIGILVDTPVWRFTI